ncbi:MAG: hypothetical protein Q4F76_10785, partial [Lachnospiraceae bacterium]|nr:hypothetical protein [Lachnospiraceae bacterium]
MDENRTNDTMDAMETTAAETQATGSQNGSAAAPAKSPAPETTAGIQANTPVPGSGTPQPAAARSAKEGQPARPLHGDDTTVTQISEGDLTAMLYDQLMGVFGAGSQLFTMEMPGRVVNQLDYAYTIEDYNSSALTKPYAVAENEFRLTDNMLDVAPIVQGPNGSRLSTTFETLINNYTPDISNIKDFITDKMQLRLFLLETITDEIDGEEVTCSRIEFCQRMYMRYLEQKYEWDQEKIDQHLKASDSGDLDGYAKWLATTSWTKDQALENLFQDAVIRGFYHEILTILGFLDVASPAERLAKAKANSRSSVRRSLDASMNVLPVQMQPSNWFRSMSPNFSPADLTLDPEYIAEQCKAKRNILTSLEAELRVLVMNSVESSEVKNMENRLKQLKEEMDQQEAAVFKSYTQNAVVAVKLIFEVMAKGNMAGLVAMGKDDVMAQIAGLSASFLKALGFDTDGSGDENDTGMALLKDIAEKTYDFYEANLEYFKTYNELINAELEYAQMQTSDYSDRIQILKERIAIVTKEVSELEVIAASGAVNDGEAFSDTSLLPGNMYNENSEYMDIVFGREDLEKIMSDSSSSYYSAVSGSVGRFLGSASVKKETSLSNTAFMQNALSSDFTIGMRATKVTVDRGGWFDAGIMDLTQSYRRIKETISGGAGLTVESILSAYNADSGMTNGKFNESSRLLVTPDGGRYILPAFPVAFLVVKDVVFRANMSSYNEEDYQDFKKSAFSTSSSFLGIRVSGGGAKESFCGINKNSETTAQFIMRIPGPQILGWFQELPSLDKSGKYEGLSKSEYFNEIIDSLKDYQEKLK